MTEPAPGQRARVLVVDDQPFFRRAVALVLDGSRRFELSAEAEHAAAATKVVAALHADQEQTPLIALVDVYLGDEDGIELCRQLRSLCPELAVVLVSTAEEVDLPSEALSCGAAGFLTKSRFSEEAFATVFGMDGHLR